MVACLVGCVAGILCAAHSTRRGIGVLTIGQRFEQTGGRPSGFDYLRISLSVSVIAWHSIGACYGGAAETQLLMGPLRPLVYLIVPCFFALSGFLIAGSLERNDLLSFLTLRGIRIFPALTLEVVLSAFLLGPLLTKLPLSTYFSNSEFYQYMLNIVGYIHYNLPGLFIDNPAGPKVNAQLWTIPFELECYIAISVLALLTLARRPGLLMGLLIAATVFSVAKQVLGHHVLPIDSTPPGRALVFCFLFGVTIYGLRNKIAWNAYLFAAAALLTYVLLNFSETTYFAFLPISYMTVYVGLLNPKKVFIIKSADYSYGMYLYGYPIQQAIALLFPSLRFWWFNLAATLLFSGLFAWFSWTFVEAPVMQRKKQALKWVHAAAQRPVLVLRSLAFRSPPA